MNVRALDFRWNRTQIVRADFQKHSIWRQIANFLGNNAAKLSNAKPTYAMQQNLHASI